MNLGRTWWDVDMCQQKPKTNINRKADSPTSPRQLLRVVGKAGVAEGERQRVSDLYDNCTRFRVGQQFLRSKKSPKVWRNSEWKKPVTWTYLNLLEPASDPSGGCDIWPWRQLSQLHDAAKQVSSTKRPSIVSTSTCKTWAVRWWMMRRTMKCTPHGCTSTSFT